MIGRKICTNKASVDSAAPISFESTTRECGGAGKTFQIQITKFMFDRTDADGPGQMTALVGRSVYNVDIVLLLLQCGFVLRAQAVQCAQALLPYTVPP